MQRAGRDFEREWSTGYWDYMRGLSHVSRYGLLSSLVLHGREAPRVLDVGCGEGTLFEHLAGRVRYLGFDVSEAAVARAQARHGDAARFRAASVTDFTSDERFDVIVFNAILYLFDDKPALVARYARMLAPGGVLVIENHTTFRAARAWFDQLGQRQDTAGWEKIAEVAPLDWLGQLARDYQLRAHYTLLNWEVKNHEFPCRHVHVFSPREERPETKPAPVTAVRGGFSGESAPYLLGTESMGGVLEALDVRGKSVLTVLGSADQLLNFYRAGASEVVGFDIARNAPHVCELKTAALRAFDRRRYLALLLELQAGLTAEGRRDLERLLPALTPPAGAWLRGALAQGGPFKVRVRKAAAVEKLNPYLATDEAYAQSRQRVRAGPLLTADLFHVGERLERRFDVVYLANVLDFNRATAAEAVRRLWPLVAEGGCIASYEFASHPQKEGEYGPCALVRHSFEGVAYGGRDSIALLRRLTDAGASADAEQDSFEQALRSSPCGQLAPFDRQGQSSHLALAACSGRSVVLRVPRRCTKVDAFASVRSHRLVRLLARRMGAPHLALPCALVETPASLVGEVHSRQMVAFPLLHASARPADELPAAALARISEQDRLAAALLCVLTAQSDAVPKNAMVDPQGRLTLLDLDTCLGRPVWYGRPSAPCFLPGQKLGPRQAYEPLPPALAALVAALAAGDTLALQLTDPEAAVLRARARAVAESGLAAAAATPPP